MNRQADQNQAGRTGTDDSKEQWMQARQNEQLQQTAASDQQPGTDAYDKKLDGPNRPSV